ncbi:MAG: hypothetical protein K2N06_11075 [Oscillospiraceae bacterium]|nr:hypothetical protein [Oscillospiraceae bacterium]
MDKQKKILVTVNVAVILVIMGGIALFMAFGKRPTVSNEERRNLAECPKFTIESYFKGDFTSDFAKFYNDTVPMRSTFKSFISAFRAHLGVKYDGGVYIHGGIPDIESRPEKPANSSSSSKKPVVVVIPDPVDNTPSTSADNESTGETSSSDKQPVELNPIEGEMSGTVFVLGDGRGLVMFYGSYSSGENYAKTLNEYKARLGEKVNVYSMTVPTSTSFYLPEKYSNMTSSESEHIDHINGLLDGVIPVDAYSAIAAHTDEEIYLRTDNHWQSLGAYYAAEEFAKTAQVDFPMLNTDNFEYVSRDGYVGTLYGYSDYDQRIKDNPETFTYYKPKTEYTCAYYDHSLNYQYTGAMMLDIDGIAVNSWYLVNMCGDNYTVNINTACKNGRRLLIVKDSYGDALPAFLTSSFEEIWVVDMRYFEKSVLELAKNEGITDVLFTMNIESAAGSSQKNLANIM